MRITLIIAEREFRQYFASPLAYAFGAMLYLILGFLFLLNFSFGMRGGQISPDGTLLIPPMIFMLTIATPALTMRLLADEHRMGTLELMLTAPVRDWELVVGKWLGSFGFMLVVLAVTWVYPLMLHRMTSPGIDQGVLISAYAGLILFVATILGIGVLISASFDSPVVAFLVTLAVLLGLWVIRSLGGGGVFGQVADYINLLDHYYDNFHRGVLDLTDTVYFVSLTALSLFLGARVVETRRWR